MSFLRRMRRGMLPTRTIAMQSRSMGRCQIKSRIRVVSLDITGTLFKFRSPIGQIYHECALHSNLSQPPSSAEFAAAFKSAFVTTSQTYPCYGFNQVSERKWTVYQEFGKPGTYALYPDTLPFLRQLTSMRTAVGDHFVVGTLTNSPHRTLECTLPSLDLQQYFQWYVSCLDIGKEKPTKCIYDHTFNLLQKQMPDLRRDEIMHIGDNLEFDLLGARNAGFQALLLDREHKLSGNSNDVSLQRYLIKDLLGVIPHLK